MKNLFVLCALLVSGFAQANCTAEVNSAGMRGWGNIAYVCDGGGYGAAQCVTEMNDYGVRGWPNIATLCKYNYDSRATISCMQTAIARGLRGWDNVALLCAGASSGTTECINSNIDGGLRGWDNVNTVCAPYAAYKSGLQCIIDALTSNDGTDLGAALSTCGY